MKFETLKLETQQKYLKFANHFYATWLPDGVITSARIRAALVSAAQNYRPASFRLLKNALAFDQRAKGYAATAREILATVNPVTEGGSKMPVKPKQARAKSFTQQQFDELSRYLHTNGYHDEFFALVLAWYCGVRPCEMRTIKTHGAEIHITGGKCSHSGTRGADRVLVIAEAPILNLVAYSAQMMSQCQRSDGAIRDRMRNEVRRVWPRRKTHPTLYTLRHQFGSNLKASGADDKVLAYMMGHQSTSSIERYGDKRCGDASLIKVKPLAAINLDKVRARDGNKKPWAVDADRQRQVSQPGRVIDTLSLGQVACTSLVSASAGVSDGNRQGI